jgi:hypothetical protein
MTPPTVRALAFLQDWGAFSAAHLGTPLIVHLRGVHALLQAWGAREALCLAGLLHAVGGTEHFSTVIKPIEIDLDAAFGAEVAALVALHADADRAAVWPQFGQAGAFNYWTRTGQSRALSERERRDYSELTMANELEILRRDRAHRDRHGGYFCTALAPLKPWVSGLAWACFTATLGRHNRWDHALPRWLRTQSRRLSARVQNR